MYPAIEINLHLDRICAAQQPSPDRHRGGVSDPNLRHQPAPFDASCRRGRLRRNGDWYADFVDTSSSPATSTPDLPCANSSAAQCRTCSRRTRSAWSTPPPSPYRMRSADPTSDRRDDHPQAPQWT